jgi:phospholipid/cholesterol/gamma-HCH transport system ATP-binding protein
MTSAHASDLTLSARGIVNRFGSQTVHDELDLDIESGEVLGIAGGSGSGKSVLLRTLCGLHRPQAGVVLVGGRPVASLLPAERAAFFGMLFQRGALFSSLTVAENVMLPMREHTRLSRDEQEELAAVKLSLVGLDAESRTKVPSALSGGMVKRAALARALALDPRVLLLDEPTAGLDPNLADGIDQLIRKLNESLGVTVVVVTHDLETLFTVCDRVAVLAEGKVVVGTPAKMLAAKQAGVRAFLSGPRVESAKTAMAHRVVREDERDGQP